MDTNHLNNKVIGIQGGRGSFNELAIHKYIRERELTSVKVKYLYTTENVLATLDKEEIDYGQFAIFNSSGKTVRESVTALANHSVKIVDEYDLLIQHSLMRIPGAKVQSILAHPQVLKQCADNLRRKYPNLKQYPGEGELIDTAKATEALVKGDLNPRTAILGRETLSELYGLEILDRNLQDSQNNETTFLLVKKKSRFPDTKILTM